MSYRHVLTGHGVKPLLSRRHQQPGLQHHLGPGHAHRGAQAEGEAPPTERRAEAQQLEAAARGRGEGHGAGGQEVGGVGVQRVQLGAVQADPPGRGVGDDVPTRHQLLPLHLEGSEVNELETPAPPPSPEGSEVNELETPAPPPSPEGSEVNIELETPAPPPSPGRSEVNAG